MFLAISRMFLFQIQTGNYLVLEFIKDIFPLLFLFGIKGVLIYKMRHKILISGDYFEAFELDLKLFYLLLHEVCTLKKNKYKAIK